MQYTSRDVYERISQQTHDPIVERRICRVSWQEFPIYASDDVFYAKISPALDGKKLLIPRPTLCPEERQRRRLMFRNERKLYKRKCDATGEGVVSVYDPASPYVVYDQKFRWSDARDPLKYGKEFDFTQTFVKQFDALMKVVPRYNLFSLSCENCDYANHIWYSKDCYLAFSTLHSQSMLYAWWGLSSSDCCDVSFVENCQWCYECIKCSGCVNVLYSLLCDNCDNSSYLVNCQWCSWCYGCDNLTNASYCIENKQYTKEEYQTELSKRKNIQPIPYTWPLGDHNSMSEWSVGSFLTRCSDVIMCHGLSDSSSCKYIRDDTDTHNNYDCYGASWTQFSCDIMSCPSGTQILFSSFVGNWQRMMYCNLCYNSSDCFGCIWLRNKQYCIFNKQYTKEEYESQVAKIISYMQETGERGEFFDASLSPFGYNETVANDYMPLDRDDAIAIWYKRQDIIYDPVIPAWSHVLQWNEIATLELSDDVLKNIFICETSWRPFRIVKAEIDFYKKYNIWLPTKHPDVRHRERMNRRPAYTIVV